MPKKILLVENLGADFYKWRLKYAECLVKNGWEVFVLVPDDEYTALIRERGITVYTYIRDHRENWFKQVARILTAYRNIFKEHKIDIVHSFRLFPNFINVIVNIFSKRKVILHVTGLGLVYSNTNFKYFIYRQISNLVYFFMICFSDKTIVQNPDDGKDLLFFPFMKKKLVLVKGSGVDTSLFDPGTADRVQLREKYGIALNDLVFICVTRLLWEKGIEELCEAFKKIAATDQRARLFIVGSPDIKNPRHVTHTYINSFDGNRQICFLGERNDIKELLLSADVFIYPSYYREGIPRSVLEALSMGLPVITTTMPGCNLTVANGNGILIEPRSANAIYEGVSNMLKRTGEFEQMSKSSRKLVADSFSDEVIYAEIRKQYAD